jgi:hypothetical protein
MVMPKYANVSVSKDLLERLKKEQDEVVGMARYGRYKAWLHYANLQSWQQQRWHFNYLNYNGVELRCTCGLIVEMDSKPQFLGLKELELDQVHRAVGHRNLPSFEGDCVAFIYDYKWMEEKGSYFFQAICQVCEGFTDLLPGMTANTFVDEHNQRCVPVRRLK